MLDSFKQIQNGRADDKVHNFGRIKYLLYIIKGSKYSSGGIEIPGLDRP